MVGYLVVIICSVGGTIDALMVTLLSTFAPGEL